jgi:hypothetical protein
MKPLVFLLIAAALTSALGAQDTPRATTDSVLTPTSPLYRDPHRARILGSLIPGAGHIYAGEYLKGVGNYVGTIGIIGMGAIIISLDDCGLLCDSKHHSHFVTGILGGLGIGAGILSWISSARDAPRAAERANERHRCKTGGTKPIIEVPAGSHGMWRAGVTIPW